VCEQQSQLVAESDKENMSIDDAADDDDDNGEYGDSSSNEDARRSIDLHNTTYVNDGAAEYVAT